MQKAIYKVRIKNGIILGGKEIEQTDWVLAQKQKHKHIVWKLKKTQAVNLELKKKIKNRVRKKVKALPSRKWKEDWGRILYRTSGFS